jgi:hypothetical protein
MEAHMLFLYEREIFHRVRRGRGEYERSVLLIGEEYLPALFRLLEHNN